MTQSFHGIESLPDTGRFSTAVAREGVVVAELLDPDEAHWLQETARNIRQSFMDPRQKAAYEEFLARQASPDRQ